MQRRPGINTGGAGTNSASKMLVSASHPSQSGADGLQDAPPSADEVYLVRRPMGCVDATTFAQRRVKLPLVSQVQPDSVLVRVEWVSADPAMRGWLSAAKNSYVPPVAIGAAMRAQGVGVALTSATGIAAGSTVTGLFGWRSACVMRASQLTMAPALPPGVPASALLGAIGITGLTAYFGLLRVGAAQATDTVLVSAAAGATGGVAVQLARHVVGATRVIGVAGGQRKCAYVREVLGADDCVDYKAGDFAKRLREALPHGVDLYFDNVGGAVLEAALRLLRQNGRVVLCGGISMYNEKEMRGPRNYLSLIARRGAMRGFIVTDYDDEFGSALQQLAGWVRDGKIAVTQDVVEGLENAPRALMRLFSGGNIGKVVVRVRHEKMKALLSRL